MVITRQQTISQYCCCLIGACWFVPTREIQEPQFFQGATTSPQISVVNEHHLQLGRQMLPELAALVLVNHGMYHECPCLVVIKGGQ